MAIRLWLVRTTAIKLLNEAVNIAPDFAPGHYNLGALHFIKGGTEKSIECLRRAVDGAFDYAPAHRLLAILYRKMGRVEPAGFHAARYETLINKREGESMRAT